jgi:hypothetical protein
MQLQTTGSVKAPGIGDLKLFEPTAIRSMVTYGDEMAVMADL